MVHACLLAVDVSLDLVAAIMPVFLPPHPSTDSEPGPQHRIFRPPPALLNSSLIEYEWQLGRSG